MDAFVPQDVRRECVRSSRVVLAPRCWSQVCGISPRAMVANKPGTPGRARSSRKTIAQGVPDDFGVPVLACVRLFRLHAWQWVRRAPGIPCALFIFERRATDASLGHDLPREC